MLPNDVTAVPELEVVIEVPHGSFPQARLDLAVAEQAPRVDELPSC